MQKSCGAGSAVLFLMLWASAAQAAGIPPEFQKCAAIRTDDERLRCFDRLTQSPGQEQQPNTATVAVPVLVAPPSPGGIAPGDDGRTSAMAEHWELYPSNKRGVFSFRPHYPNYFIATYNSQPNDAPYLPFRSLAPESGGLSRKELLFQLGFKLKLVENAFRHPVDLWLGYTQRSFWQAGNQQASSPFRETDYQPELMAVIPTNMHLAGFRMRLINVGLIHQSNGQASTLSRSWNRAYLQVGLERGNFTLLARAWKRFNEPLETDDNPDIVNYMGHGDLMLTYRRNGHEFSLLSRYNFSTNKGAAQISWAFPLISNLKGYVQYFSGYGHSLIDYNAYQRVAGLGVLVNF